MAKTPQTLVRLKQLDDERAKLLEDAKKEAMQKVQDAMAELNALGFNYQLVQSATAARTRAGTRTVKDAPCPICGFKTSPPHDRRAHRMQATKKPFTDAELAARGMKRA